MGGECRAAHSPLRFCSRPALREVWILVDTQQEHEILQNEAIKNLHKTLLYNFKC